MSGILTRPSGLIRPAAVAAYAAAVLADSPIAYWKLDEASGSTMADSSGNGRGGSYVGSPTLGATGLVLGGGTSVTLDGSTQYGNPTDVAAFDVDTVTLEAWIKTSQTTSSPMIIGRDQSSGTQQRSFQFRLNLGKPEFLAFIGASSGLLTGTSTTAAGTVGIADGATHHVVGTYDGTTLLIYVDGSQVGTASRSGFLAFGVQPAIGARQSNATGPTFANFLAGTVGHVAYYGTALSSTRIAAHYAAGH